MGVVGFAEAPVNLTRRGLSDEVLKLQEGIWHSHFSVLACVIPAGAAQHPHFCRLLSWRGIRGVAQRGTCLLSARFGINTFSPLQIARIVVLAFLKMHAVVGSKSNVFRALVRNELCDHAERSIDQEMADEFLHN